MSFQALPGHVSAGASGVGAVSSLRRRKDSASSWSEGSVGAWSPCFGAEKPRRLSDTPSEPQSLERQVLQRGWNKGTPFFSVVYFRGAFPFLLDHKRNEQQGFHGAPDSKPSHFGDGGGTLLLGVNDIVFQKGS